MMTKEWIKMFYFREVKYFKCPKTPVCFFYFPEPSKWNLNNISPTFSTKAQRKKGLYSSNCIQNLSTLFELCELS